MKISVLQTDRSKMILWLFVLQEILFFVVEFSRLKKIPD